jgi:hypothetical protein
MDHAGAAGPGSLVERASRQGHTIGGMARRERDILERAVQSVTEQPSRRWTT